MIGKRDGGKGEGEVEEGRGEVQEGTRVKRRRVEGETERGRWRVRRERFDKEVHTWSEEVRKKEHKRGRGEMILLGVTITTKMME